MGFMIARRNGRYGMRAFCDRCGKEVIDGMCNVLSRRDIAEGSEADIKIACKAVCTDAIDPKGKLANQELGVSVVYLTNNARIDVELAKRIVWHS